jgi:hypothetical protein
MPHFKWILGIIAGIPFLIGAFMANSEVDNKSSYVALLGYKTQLQ